jgi:hypothetical protein
LQLPLADRQTIMAAASSVRPDEAQAAIVRAVAVKTPAQDPRPSDRKLAPSPELPYNQKRTPAAPASPQPIELAAADAEQKPRAGKNETHATDPIGLLTRHLAYKAPGNKIAAYSAQWNNFKFDAPAKFDVVLIQRITVEGSSNVDGKLGPIQYFEILGFIKTGQTNLGKLDYWNYVGDVQYPKGKPQITEEEIKQTGQVTAYEYTDELKTVLDTWKPFQPIKIGNTFWSSGGYPSSRTFDVAGARVVEAEAEPHVLISTWNPKAKNRLKVD